MARSFKHPFLTCLWTACWATETEKIFMIFFFFLYHLYTCKGVKMVSHLSISNPKWSVTFHFHLHSNLALCTGLEITETSYAYLLSCLNVFTSLHAKPFWAKAMSEYPWWHEDVDKEHSSRQFTYSLKKKLSFKHTLYCIIKRKRECVFSPRTHCKWWKRTSRTDFKGRGGRYGSLINVVFEKLLQYLYQLYALFKVIIPWFRYSDTECMLCHFKDTCNSIKLL